VKNSPRFLPSTAGIKPFCSHFRWYKTPFPTVEIIALGARISERYGCCCKLFTQWVRVGGVRVKVRVKVRVRVSEGEGEVRG
jgi:hypothetical protein